VRSLYFKIFSASFFITFLSPEIATSINIHVLFSFYIIIIIIMSPQACFRPQYFPYYVRCSKHSCLLQWISWMFSLYGFQCWSWCWCSVMNIEGFLPSCRYATVCKSCVSVISFSTEHNARKN
jgi:hypothetical protein